MPQFFKKVFVVVCVAVAHLLIVSLLLHQVNMHSARDDVVMQALIVGESVFDISFKAKHRSRSEEDLIYSDVGTKKNTLPLKKYSVEMPDFSSESLTEAKGLDGQRFFRFEDLEKPAFPVIDIVIPHSTTQFISITARVEIFIDRFGIVQKVNILSINSDYFSENLKEAIFATKFTPALRGGFPVNSIKTMEIVIRY